jgi:hypothetical protein
MAEMKAEPRNTGRELDRLAQPLARALGTIRTTLAGWDEAQIWNAVAALEKCSPLDPGDPDMCEAERILRDALDRANAERMARNAPWLGVDVICDNGRWTLSAWHDRAEVLRREYPDFAAARAAGETLHAFLGLEGRAREFSYESPRREGPADPRDLDSEVPF